jgi:addiction module HigA family antidote
MSTMAEKRPIYPIHPGEVLAGELDELGMTAAELARALHVPSNRLYQLIAGKRAMTADTALRLERWLGVSAGFWMNLQKRYELDVASEKIGEEIKRTILPRPTFEIISESTHSG